MTSQALAVPQDESRQGAIELLISLEHAGAATEVALVLTDTSMPYDQWEALGRVLGEVDRRSRWYIGDWLNAGEQLYGEEYAQAIEDTPETRYSLAERTTGLDHGTLMNIKSVCGRVDKGIRRKELPFSMHADVAALEPKHQKKFLNLAVKHSWKRSELRDAIRAEFGPEPPADDDDEPGGGGVTVCERIQLAAESLLATAQQTSHGTFEVQPEPIAQLRAAFGQE